MSQPESASSDGISSVSLSDRTPDVLVTKPNRPRKRVRPSSTKDEAEDVSGVQNLLRNIPVIGQDFEIISKIGEGTFSSVFLANLKCNQEKVAIKHLVPTSSTSRMENEIYCLEKMGGKDHVISLLAYVRQDDHIALIMPFFKHDKFTDYLPLMCVGEVRRYMRALFEALRKVHSHKIIHRDIKPSNFLYNRISRKFLLVDFGLAHMETQAKEDKGSILKATQGRSTGQGPLMEVGNKTRHRSIKVVTHPSSSQPRTARQSSGIASKPSSFITSRDLALGSTGTSCQQGGRVKEDHHRGCVRDRGRSRDSSAKMRSCDHKETALCKSCLNRGNQVAPRAGTPGFRAPEVLIKYPKQTTAVDIWSAGVILLCLLSGRYPFFKAHDDMCAMAQITELFGSSSCIKAAKSLGKSMLYKPMLPPLNLKRLCEGIREADTITTSSGEEDTTSEQVYQKTDERDSPSPVDEPQVKKKRQIKTEPERISCCDSKKSCVCSWNQVPESAYDLLNKCLDLNPHLRIDAGQALCHSFLTERHKR